MKSSKQGATAHSRFEIDRRDAMRGSLGLATNGALLRGIACALLAVAALLVGCATRPPPVCVPSVPSVPSAPKAKILQPVSFDDLPGWSEETFADSLPGLTAACARFGSEAAWQPACAAVASLAPSPQSLRSFYERYFTPWRASTPQGDTSGLITGYYEPLLHGSRVRHGPYQVPLYAPPDDLLTIALAAVNPALRHMHLRGRLKGRRVVPYYSRAQIERGLAPLAGKELLWVNDPLEAFFLQIQGSGRVQLDNGKTVRLVYSDQNGQPYVSIGRVLVARGALTAAEATMEGIEAWARSHPDRLAALLDQNPSYVFFREIPDAHPELGPRGALGVPLVPKRSIAVDPRYLALGAPVFLATTWPGSERPLERLVFAQDTGGAIRGPVRADFFWGFGDAAGREAGKMRQSGRLWLLWPSGALPPAPLP